MESPPSSKKPSSIPTRSTASTSANMAHNACSRSVLAARDAAPPPNSGAGSAR